MKAYIITLIVLFSLSILGTAINIMEQNLKRDPDMMIWDILLYLVLVIWGLIIL